MLATSLVSGLLLAIHFSFQQQNKSLLRQVVALKESTTEIHRRFQRLSLETGRIEFPSDLIWVYASKADAELALQKLVVDRATEFGMEIVRFGNASLTHETSNEVVSFRLEVEGSLGDVLGFLEEIENHTPKIALAAMRIRPSRRHGPTNQSSSIHLQVTPWVYWGELE